jgi:putative Holliday junction resolvase
MPEPGPPAVPSFPEHGALLGIDYGTKRVGVALSTPDRVMASPLDVHVRRDERQDAKFFKELVADYRVVGLVVGLPVHVAGHESKTSQDARGYGQWLSQITGLPLTFWDERYTSSVAEEQMIAVDLTRQQRKQRIDKVAAVIMLQAYLNHHLPRPADRDGEAEPDVID